MSLNQKSIWAALHVLTIVAVTISLTSGTRIAVLEYPFLLQFHYLLPQGEMHHLHISAAVITTAATVIYTLLLAIRYLPGTRQFNGNGLSHCYHLFTARLLRVVIFTLLISGWLLYLENPTVPVDGVKIVHLIAAGLMVLYVLLHGGGYIVQLGINTVRRIFIPLRFISNQAVIIALPIAILVLSGSYLLFNNQHHTLTAKAIAPDVYIEIDGKAAEPAWQQAESLTVKTHGGANFENGSTAITIRALHNGTDAFFHFRWKDATQSLEHLPLIKIDSGWQVRQDGFHEFDERTWYEDKFAVILSCSCEMDAAGTAHLGPQPLADKPKHWTGKGYHYREKGMVDLWQWKAVRTNSMHLMDDNYIGQPAKPRAGDRRYTAGYQQDGRESGAYKMNWQWYKRDGIVPRRLPNEAAQLNPYQSGSSVDNIDAPWVIPWFGSTPYHKSEDNYPIGTIMPSILYTSNQFEGDRAHVRAFATWEKGYWSLEVFRPLDTQSSKDIRIEDGICLWVAAFDHSQIAHTRHVRPIQLEIVQ